MALARAEAEREQRADEVPRVTIQSAKGFPQRRQATDDLVAARFKQREREKKPRRK